MLCEAPRVLSIATGRRTASPGFFRHLLHGVAVTVRFLCMLTMLSACGSDPGTRAVTGGLLGAGAGAGVAAVTGGRPATGALIGGGVGAVGGAVTSPRF